MAEGMLETTEPPPRVESRIVPLNSKKLTAILVRQLAAELGLPTTAPLGELKLLVDGKIEELGQETRKVQAVLTTREAGITVTLFGVEGQFLEAEPIEEYERTTHGPVSPPLEDGEESGGDDGSSIEGSPELLKRKLEEVSQQNESLEGEVSSLKSEIERLNLRMSEVWRMSCEQVSQWDATVTAKDEEIAELKAKYEEMTRLPLSGSTRGAVRSDMSDEELSAAEDNETRGLAHDGSTHSHSRGTAISRRKGRAPPLDSFDGETPGLRLDDWLPGLENRYPSGTVGRKRSSLYN